MDIIQVYGMLSGSDPLNYEDATFGVDIRLTPRDAWRISELLVALAERGGDFKVVSDAVDYARKFNDAWEKGDGARDARIAESKEYESTKKGANR